MDPQELQDEMEDILKRAATASSESATEEPEQTESPEELTDAMAVIRKRREARQKKEEAETTEAEQPETGEEVSDALAVIRKKREARQKRQEEEEKTEEEQPLSDVAESTEAEEEPRIYVVEKGDSLWSIAEKVYGDGTRWKEIRKANKDVIKDPKVIRPGWKLRIP